MIPLSRPDISPEDYRAISRVLESGQLTRGPETLRFEEAAAEYIGVSHAICGREWHGSVVPFP